LDRLGLVGLNPQKSWIDKIYFGVIFGGAKSVPNQNEALVSSSEVTDFARELGGRTRARTWDPMIKSQRDPLSWGDPKSIQGY
jgi:hypothetical protein